MELTCENCCNEKIIHKGKYDVFIECQDCLRGCVDKMDGCCIAPDIIQINMPRIDKKPTKRNFCRRCGNVSPMVKMENPEEWKTLPLVTREIADSISHERFNKRQAFYKYLQQKRHEHFEDRKKEYAERYYEYLETDTWRDKRVRVLNRDKYICQACLISKATQVHHLTYTRIFKEPLFDLTSVCNDCHKDIHDIDIELFGGTDEEQIIKFEIDKLIKVLDL
jgi:hypothetical protein